RAEHAVLERGIGVRLGQNGEAVAQADGGDAITRGGRDRLPLRAGGREGAVEVRGESGLLLPPAGHRGQTGIRDPGDQAAGAGRAPRAVVGDGVAVVRAVCRVAVDEESRVPFVEEVDQGTDFRTFQLHEIAIEVEALGVGANTDALDGATLRGAVGLGDALV